jgi:glycosyltransferase involved in cell wall biosynthesis
MKQMGDLLYISGYYLDDDNASTEHVWEISCHLARLGWQVTLVGLTKKESIDNKFNEPPDGLTIVSVQASHSGKNLPLVALWQKVTQVTKQRHFDLAYIRPARKTLLAVWWLRWRRIPYIVEVNANIVGEYQSIGANRVTVALADVLEKLQFHGAQGAFCVTRELAAYAASRIPNSTNVWITGNGFRGEETDLAIFDERTRETLGVSQTETVIIFLGLLQIWQGVDLVMEALADLPDTQLWIVGDGPEKPYLQQLANQLGIEARVHWFSYRRRSELQALLNASDIGIGTLAMLRKKMQEAQPLKVRHYLGVGLPVIIGYDDTLLDKDSPGVFYARTVEEIIAQIGKIKSDGSSRNLSYRQEIREFALQRLSWAAIAKQTSDILSEWLTSAHDDPK